MCALIAIAANLPCLMESCSNFLRPACPYTGCRLSSLTGSKPHGEHSCQLRLLFFCLLIVTNPALSSMALVLSVDAVPFLDTGRLLVWMPLLQRHHERVSIPEPWQIPAPQAGSCQDSGTVHIDYAISVLLLSCLHIYATASFPAAGCLISFIIFSGSYSIPCLRIA